MALVRDDGGKIVGLLTLEDVLEEIVGDIEDEHDLPRPQGPSRRLRKLRANPRSETRNPKSEFRNPKQIQNPKSQ
jgi:putative hemolysin